MSGTDDDLAGGYAETPEWPKLPRDLDFAGDAAAVAIGPDELIYVFNRGPQRMIILRPDGTYAGGWGDAGTYARPHGVTACADGDLLLVDAGSHIVEKVHPDGERVLRLGIHGRASTAYSGEPFNQPTDAAEHPRTREIFVADGYGNSRIHRHDADGRHVLSWGEPGTGAAQLSNPHGICFLDDDHLAVCDRENYRIQIFELDGKLAGTWHWHHPCAIRRSGDLLYIAELGPPSYMHGTIPNMGCSVTIANKDGKALGRLGGRLPGVEDGRFLAPHGMAVAEDGALYVAEVNAVYLEALGKPVPPRETLPCLRRWSRT
ncbi:hypothetical protein [Amycolatopsis sp. GM8]|uniref:hypothetical protein n=1 Tax=Amycolatopsis sp. GM8 TaxID=2896530 RepID=UPI001F259395|nr:hypothetical protein [Amycolatopsis sp. GM8]